MRIQGLTISEALGDIRSEYLLEAEEAYFVAITQKRRPSRNGWLTRFVNSGWGVAIICALVAISVMGGIIWAGNRHDGPGIRPPVGNQYTEDLTFEQETMETIDPPAAEIAAKAPEIAWEKPIKSVQITAFYSMVTYNMIAAGDHQITEISLATHEDDTRTLMFRLINRETYEVMAHYCWDATEGKWGVMTVEEGIFLVYRATEQGAMTTLWIDFFVWLPELDPATYECVGSFYPKILPESRPYLWKHPRVEETGEWGRFVKELFTDFPTTYLCMDEALGDLAFYTEDNRYTDGWERMRLFWQDLYILDGEEITDGLEIVTEKAEAETYAPTETTENHDTDYDTEATRAEENTSAPKETIENVDPPVEPDGNLPMNEPYIWPTFTPSAEEVALMAELDLPDHVAEVRRHGVYIQQRAGRESQWRVMELREIIYTDQTAVLHLLLRDPQSGTLISQYEYPLGNSRWGLFQDEEGLFVVYTITRTEETKYTLALTTFVWSSHDIYNGSSLDGVQLLTYRENSFPIHYSGSSWNAMKKRLKTMMDNGVYADMTGDGSRPLKARLVADGIFGEFAFFGDEDISTAGWDRWEKYMEMDLSWDLLNAMPYEKAEDSLPSISEMNIHRVSYIEYDADFLLPIAEEAAAHIAESALPVYRSDEEKPTGEGCLRFVVIPEETLGYYGYRIERTEQAITLYAASPNGSMEAFVYLAESFVTGYEDGYYLIFEDKDFLPIGSTVEVRE